MRLWGGRVAAPGTTLEPVTGNEGVRALVLTWGG